MLYKKNKNLYYEIKSRRKLYFPSFYFLTTLRYAKKEESKGKKSCEEKEEDVNPLQSGFFSKKASGMNGGFFCGCFTFQYFQNNHYLEKRIYSRER